MEGVTLKIGYGLALYIGYISSGTFFFILVVRASIHFNNNNNSENIDDLLSLVRFESNRLFPPYRNPYVDTFCSIG